MIIAGLTRCLWLLDFIQNWESSNFVFHIPPLLHSYILVVICTSFSTWTRIYRRSISTSTLPYPVRSKPTVCYRRGTELDFLRIYCWVYTGCKKNRTLYTIHSTLLINSKKNCVMYRIHKHIKWIIWYSNLCSLGLKSTQFKYKYHSVQCHAPKA